MKGFEEFNIPSKSNKKKLWDNCVFVFDTTVLLNLYRYTKSTSDDLLQIFEQIKDRIWIPHQVALEYNYNRLNVMMKQNNSYQQLSNEINNSYTEFVESLKIKLNDFSRHPLIDLKDIYNEFEEALKKVKEQIDNAKSSHPKLHEDIVYNKINELFDNKVGENPYNQKDLNEIFEIGNARYENSVPPGYEDVKQKRGSIRVWNDLIYKLEYSDLVIWKQIIIHAKQIEKPIVFILDDNKKDWWQIISGKTIGPRHELIREMNKEAEQDFYMYRAHQFMTIVKEQFDDQIKSESIEEAENLKFKISDSDVSKLLIENLSSVKENKYNKANNRYFKQNLIGNVLVHQKPLYQAYTLLFTVMKKMDRLELMNYLYPSLISVFIETVSILPDHEQYDSDQIITVVIQLNRGLSAEDLYNVFKSSLLLAFEDVIPMGDLK
ncbi:PIN-like domain-containing protein [Paenibacillus sp. KACC 21273]|uniref:PIN-like domain-containing protein n=1 Tax=Paenibacillus sp. KACC 21273 TaxID=3025665 RepID=UPI0023670C27|nr:PIN-like domain-containing protein [Paenibacillus sp. KACC 21273]WDF52878.1 PIN-like domain-containing protein [Paenibacillus sp. KACC 21273]